MITPKYAIGISVNGREIRAAFLTLTRGKARIKALESTKLPEPLDQMKQVEQPKFVSLNDLENAFDINEPEVEEEGANAFDSDMSTEKTAENPNVSLLYSLMDRFQHIKANVAINAPVLNVKYDILKSAVLQKDKNLRKKIKEKIDIWGNPEDGGRGTNYINISGDKVLQIDYDYHPPIIDLIEEVNQFRAGNLHLVMMDTNELALTDLVKEIYKLKKEEITAIVYIEDDFSRVIFLKGQDLYHITPIIHKGSMSDDVLEVIYSKVIFAQDQHFIPEINKILVAGHSSRLKAKYYFRQKFPYAICGYLNSKKIESDLRFKDRGLLFSRYAVPIALAWKALQKNAYNSKEKNFLPEYITENQRLPKLSMQGYVLLIFLAVTAFAFTWLIVAKNLDIKNIKHNIQAMQSQLESNNSLTKKVASFDDQIVDLETKISLVEKYNVGHEETIDFLNRLNESISRIGDVWITQLRKTGRKVTLTGVSRRRDSIPQLANSLGGASLKKVTRTSEHQTTVFSFLLEKNLDENRQNNNLGVFANLLGQSGNKGSGETGANGSAKNYGVEVGIFDSHAEALNAAKAYFDRYDTAIQDIPGDGTVKYKLILGEFSDRQGAENLAKNLKKEGITGSVTALTE